jgi:hypothetical protein
VPDFVQCPQCSLKHSPRDDGLCPRCQNAVVAGAGPAVEPPAAALAPAPASSVVEQLRLREAGEPGVVTAGSRAAGLVLLVNALVSVASVAMLPADGGLNPVHGIVADLAVGIALISGHAKWQKWAYVRAVLGGLLFGGILAAQGNWLGVAFQLMLSTSLVLLLAGHPGKLRLGAALSLCTPYFVLAAIGLLAGRSGANPLSSVVLSARGEIEPASGTIRGSRFAYCIEVPARGWFLRTEAAARRDNPLSDRWLTRPDLDAHVMVIGEEVASGTVSQERFEDALVGEARSRLADFHMVGRDPLPAGAALHYTGRHQRLNLEYYRGAFARGTHAYQVVAFATPEHFARLHGELSSMLQSFRPECDVTAGAAKTP